jgi:endo-alpha-1,4-polygalactosaminidase (GH114 family)
MAFKYKLAEDIHAGTKGMFKDLLDKWDAEGKEKEAEIAKLPQDFQDKIKNMAKEVLSKKKCYECKTIKK